MKSKPFTARMTGQQLISQVSQLSGFPYPHDIRDDRHALNIMHMNGLLPSYQAKEELGIISVDKFIQKSF